MIKTLLISTNYLIQNEPTLDPNINVGILTSSIKRAQEQYTRSILGEHLYDAIQDKIINGDITENGTGVYNDLFLKFVQPALVQWSAYRAVLMINNHLTNKAVSKRNSDFSKASTDSEAMRLSMEYKNFAEDLDYQIYEFLVNNSSSIPELYSSTGVLQLRPKKNVYSNSVYLPSRGPRAGGYGYGYGYNPYGSGYIG